VKAELIGPWRSSPSSKTSSLRILTRKTRIRFLFSGIPPRISSPRVMELYPTWKLRHWFRPRHRFSTILARRTIPRREDLAKIEKKMHELAGQDLPNERETHAQAEALALQKNKSIFKCELVEKKAASRWFPSTPPENHRLRRGPHIPSTEAHSSLQLMSVAGAYWKGQEGNPQLQRIYAIAFFTQKELDEHLHRLEEAKRRDHRKLGTELDLFSIQEEAGPGLIFWHPKGGLIRKIVEDWLREELLKRGYDLVYTPHIMRLDLWKTSGHTGFYKDSMFVPWR